MSIGDINVVADFNESRLPVISECKNNFDAMSTSCLNYLVQAL